MKKNIKYVVVIIIGIGVIFLSTLIYNHRPTIIERIIKDGGLIFNIIVAIPFSNDKINTCDNINKELENQINELKEVINVNDILSEYELINAVVISHDIGYWYDEITINKGQTDDIKEGMVVINNSGVIGKVVSTTNLNSTVRLLTSQNIGKTSIKIENNGQYLYGIISSYDEKNNVYLVEGISKDVDISSSVLTTGYGDKFPAGILVGEVVNSKSDNYDLTKTIEISPSVDFNNLNIVSVIKRNVDK